MQADSLPFEPPGKSKNIGVGNLSLLQGNFPTQELNQGALHCRQILYQLSYLGSPQKRLCPRNKLAQISDANNGCRGLSDHIHAQGLRMLLDTLLRTVSYKKDCFIQKAFLSHPLQPLCPVCLCLPSKRSQAARGNSACWWLVQRTIY